MIDKGRLKLLSISSGVRIVHPKEGMDVIAEEGGIGLALLLREERDVRLSMGVGPWEDR